MMKYARMSRRHVGRRRIKSIVVVVLTPHRVHFSNTLHAAHYTHLLARHCFNALDCITEEVGGPPSATHFNAAQPALLANERERASEGGREVLEIDVDHSDCGKGVSGGKRQGRANERGRAITALLSRKDALCTHASPPPSTPQSSRLESSSSLPPQCNSGASRLCYVHIPLRSALGGAV